MTRFSQKISSVVMNLIVSYSKKECLMEKLNHVPTILSTVPYEKCLPFIFFLLTVAVCTCS